jgi:hypothetical protein
MKTNDKIIESLREKREEHQPIFEMANIEKEATGLPFDMWIDSAGKTRNTTHNSQRVKIKKDGKEIEISFFGNEPKIEAGDENLKNFGVGNVNKVKKYIKKHKALFVARWNNEIKDAAFSRATELIRDNPDMSTDEVLQKTKLSSSGSTRTFGYTKILGMYKAGALKVNDKGELTYTYSEDSDMKGKTVVCVDSEGEPYLDKYFKR